MLHIDVQPNSLEQDINKSIFHREKKATWYIFIIIILHVIKDRVGRWEIPTNCVWFFVTHLILNII